MNCYFTWKKVQVVFNGNKFLIKKKSLESLGKFFFFSRVEHFLKFQVKFKYSVWENRSLNLCYCRRSEAFFKLHYFWTCGSFSSWWNPIKRREGESEQNHKTRSAVPRRQSNLLNWITESGGWNIGISSSVVKNTSKITHQYS